MGKFKQKLRSFMYGRYGGDTLNFFLLGVYLFLFLAYWIASILIPQEKGITHLILNLASHLVSILLFIVIFFRIFSRNILKRRRENERFCGFFRLWRSRFRDRKTHVFRKCPKCRAVLRLPKAKGKHTVVCPRCKHRFSVRG